MRNPFSLGNWLQAVLCRGLYTLGLVVGLSACVGVAGASGSGGSTWQEEVLLHDGQRLIAERYVLRGGRSEIGQPGSYTQQSLQFIHPKTSQPIVWTDNRSEDIGTSSFLPMLLDVVKGTPYLVASPMGCLSYNKWGRPNPPYVVFKHEANGWQRIPLDALPLEIKTPNLVQSMPDLVAAQEPQRHVAAQRIAQIVAEYRQPEYRTILREPMTSEQILSMCDELVNYKGHWIDPRNPFARRNIDDKQK